MTYIAVLLSVWVMFVLYLAYVAIMVSRRNGKLTRAPLVVRVLCTATMVVMLVTDVLFNVIIGTLLFLEWPERKRLTFTKRCEKHLRQPGWRGRIASWICEGWLNVFDEHCK